MAKNISLLGADYPDVPAVQLPQTGGGTATYYDINVIDNLNSTSATDALSANQGRVLSENTSAMSYLSDQIKTKSIQAEFNIDNIDGSNFYIYRCREDNITGSKPNVGSNAYILMGFSTANYGVQLAFGFGSSKIAIRNKPFASSWSAWTYITGS